MEARTSVRYLLPIVKHTDGPTNKWPNISKTINFIKLQNAFKPLLGCYFVYLGGSNEPLQMKPEVEFFSLSQHMGILSAGPKSK